MSRTLFRMVFSNNSVHIHLIIARFQHKMTRTCANKKSLIIVFNNAKKIRYLYFANSSSMKEIIYARKKIYMN